MNIPASCPDCATQNPSDKPNCELYLTCFYDNDCTPKNPCGQLNGVCGWNTIGGGLAGYDAAVATFNCACP